LFFSPLLSEPRLRFPPWGTLRPRGVPGGTDVGTRPAEGRSVRRYAGAGGAEPLPPANEIAERIKSLKSAHSIEPAPQRIAILRTAAAEEPVTARIRRRVDPPAEPEPVVEPVADASLAIAEPIILRIDADTPAPARSKPSYQDRVSRDKPKKARQMSMF
jgi:hypothetical protein